MAPEDPNVKPAPQKTTLRGINKALRLAGREERLARGRGYFYFTGGNASQWPVSVVYIVDLNTYTAEQWLDQLTKHETEWKAR